MTATGFDISTSKDFFFFHRAIVVAETVIQEPQGKCLLEPLISLMLWLSEQVRCDFLNVKKNG
jgi:hypothetical protein